MVQAERLTTQQANFDRRSKTMKVRLSWFSVNDFEGAKKFYGKVLGLKKTFEAQQWAEFAGAEGQETIGVAVNPQAGKEPGATIVLHVEDIERERTRLEAAGVKFEGKIEEIPGIVRLTTFRDPSGNRLQLAQPLMQY
jgi:predicted enzyme related to lactoylglutathione lyase